MTETKAAKIRALANEGRSRVEISKLLGIRYQHVRNVLLRSNVSGGLHKVVGDKRDRADARTEESAVSKAHWEVLADSGFQLLGEWELNVGGLIRIDRRAPSESGVYAFVMDEAVVYIGLTKRGFHTRFEQYRRGHSRQ